MKKVIAFLLFLVYATAIFLIPNNIYLLCPLFINILLLIITKVNLNKAIKNLLKYLPFILFTFVINCFLDNYINAIWVSLKLLLVCNITYIYSKTTTEAEIAKTAKKICMPLKIFKINPEEIGVLVAISLSMLPILKREYLEIKEACQAKNIKLNIKNMKIILFKLLNSYLKRVNEIDEALIEKGYDY